MRSLCEFEQYPTSKIQPAFGSWTNANRPTSKHVTRQRSHRCSSQDSSRSRDTYFQVFVLKPTLRILFLHHNDNIAVKPSGFFRFEDIVLGRCFSSGGDMKRKPLLNWWLRILCSAPWACAEHERRRRRMIQSIPIFPKQRNTYGGLKSSSNSWIPSSIQK